MNRTKILLLLLCLLVSLTGCSQEESPKVRSGNEIAPLSEELTKAAQGGHDSLDPPAAKPIDETSGIDIVTDIKTEDKAPANDSTPNEDESTVLQPIAKLYEMNEAYDIVPKAPETDKRVVLLTIDDGPKNKEMIEQMITILNKHDAKAIFFVNGFRIKQNPDLLKLLHDNGQVIGNHSWDHVQLSKLSQDEIDRQIKDVQKIVSDITGTAPQFFRPPFGAGNDYIREKVAEEKMLYMTWSNGSLDWDKANKNNPSGVILNVMEQLRSGSNILMHELPWTVEALDELLTKITEQGYGFVDPRTIEVPSSH